MLPDWIELPPLRPYADIYFRIINRDFAVELSTGEYSTFETLEEAYEFCRGFDFEITDRALQEAGAENDAGFIFLPNHRLLLVLNDIERWDMLQNNFHESVYNIRRWRENPSLDNAYWMLDTHPALWTRHVEEPTWEWKTNGHTDDLMHKFHDLRLDIYEDTLENCILKMAELVDKFFHEDGNER